MHALLRALFAVTAVCLAMPATTANASATCRGFSFDEHYTLDNQTLVLNGLGIRRAFTFVKVYVAGLYLTKKTTNPRDVIEGDQPRALTLKMLRSVTKDQMGDAWTKGFIDNAPALWPAIKPRISAMANLIHDMKEGDVATFAFHPGVGVDFIINGKLEGTMPGDDFGRALFSIYAGPKPPNEGLKTGVLGGPCE